MKKTLILLVLTIAFSMNAQMDDIVNVGNHMYNVIAFFVMTLVIFSLSYNR